jgi:hypothetical protein
MMSHPRLPTRKSVNERSLARGVIDQEDLITDTGIHRDDLQNEKEQSNGSDESVKKTRDEKGLPLLLRAGPSTKITTAESVVILESEKKKLEKRNSRVAFAGMRVRSSASQKVSDERMP